MTSTDIQKHFHQRLHSIALEYAFLAPLVWLLTLLSTFLLPAKLASELPKATVQNKTMKTPSLFPSISNVSIEEEEQEPEESAARPVPCSTGITTRLLPYKNAKGEIEWAFTEDLPPGSELDAFRIHGEPPTAVKKETDDILSPVTSSSSNNDSLVYDKNGSLDQVNTPSSTSSEDDKHSGKEDDDQEAGAGESTDGQLHQCPHCNTSFKMRGYLTRHIKKHSSEKAYKCPFHKSSIYKDNNGVVHQCHPTGGFSRRDTYKTHLKSRHFRYPENTPIKERNKTAGNCSMCGEWFESGEVWCEIHIEGGECKHLPPGFKGKSRIKNRLRKELARMMKEQKKSKLRKTTKPAAPKMQSPILGTPSSMATPMPPTTSSCDYNDSPTSVSSHMTAPQNGFLKTLSFKQDLPEVMVNNPTLHDMPLGSLEDYGDDFCLDTEQLNLPFPAPEMLLLRQADLSQFMGPVDTFTPQSVPSMPPQPMPQGIYEQPPQQNGQQHGQQHQIPKHIRTQMQMQMPMGFHGDEHLIREKGY